MTAPWFCQDISSLREIYSAIADPVKYVDLSVAYHLFRVEVSCEARGGPGPARGGGGGGWWRGNAVHHGNFAPRHL